MKNLLIDIENRFSTTDAVERNNKLAFLTVEKNRALALVIYLKENVGFTSLTLLTAVDWIEENLFQLTYMINNPNTGVEFGIRVMIDREEASMESAHHLWESIWVYQ